MPRYMSLISFTESGVRQVGESISRAEQFRSDVEAAGGQVEATWWALGEFDGAVVFRAPDDATSAALLLNLARAGNVRTKTMTLYDAAEFKEIAARM